MEQFFGILQNPETKKQYFPFTLADAVLGIKKVAKTGSYQDLSDVPTIPTKTSDLVNNSGFITSSSLPIVNDATLTIQCNGETIDKFSANASDDTTINIRVPAAQVNSDWNATSGVARILNKPTIPSTGYSITSLTINDAEHNLQHYFEAGTTNSVFTSSTVQHDGTDLIILTINNTLEDAQGETEYEINFFGSLPGTGSTGGIQDNIPYTIVLNWPLTTSSQYKNLHFAFYTSSSPDTYKIYATNSGENTAVGMYDASIDSNYEHQVVKLKLKASPVTIDDSVIYYYFCAKISLIKIGNNIYFL